MPGRRDICSKENTGEESQRAQRERKSKKEPHPPRGVALVHGSATETAQPLYSLQ